MLEARANLSLVLLSTRLNKFMECTLIKSDTKDNYSETLKELNNQFKNSEEHIDDYEIVFEPMSNINESDMTDLDKYCMTYYRRNGEQGILINANKKQIMNRVRTLKLSLQTDAYEHASLYKMSTALNIHQVRENYSNALGNI